MAPTLYYEQDADMTSLAGKTIAVFGYGSQGHAQANNFRDSGLQVIIGARSGGASATKAAEDGFTVLPFAEAAAKADLVHLLLPDELHESIFNEIKASITPGKILSCSHGLNFHFEIITPPEGVDVIMMAPKAPGPTVRREYVNNYGVPALVAVHTDASGQALTYAIALAKANGSTKVGCFHTTFKDETETDLFGEQTVLCGGAAYLMKSGFDTLVAAGYPPEMAYFECVHELKLIVDLVYRGGVHGMSKKISNTAKWGQFTVGPDVINDQSRAAMQTALENIRSKNFVRNWLDVEYKQKHLTTLKQHMETTHEWDMEKTGRTIRKVAGLEEVETGEE